jgi:hypothetical protein
VEEGFEPSIPREEALRGEGAVVVRQCSKTPANRRIFSVVSSRVFAVVRVGWCQRWCQKPIRLCGDLHPLGSLMMVYKGPGGIGFGQ